MENSLGYHVCNLVDCKTLSVFCSTETRAYLLGTILPPHHWGSGLILRLDVQKRIKQKLNFNANKFVLSEMKDKKLPKERRVRSKNKKYYSPMCEYKLTEMGELVRNGLLKIN